MEAQNKKLDAIKPNVAWKDNSRWLLRWKYLTQKLATQTDHLKLSMDQQKTL